MLGFKNSCRSFVNLNTLCGLIKGNYKQLWLAMVETTKKMVGLPYLRLYCHDNELSFLTIMNITISRVMVICIS
jgi:hypothetical protein